MQTIIPMANGSTVIAATLSTHLDSGDVNGVVLAEHRGQYVTWTVGRTVVMGPDFQAFNGHYHDTLTAARADYHNRRA
jgi:hypothetical protein